MSLGRPSELPCNCRCFKGIKSADLPVQQATERAVPQPQDRQDLRAAPLVERAVTPTDNVGHEAFAVVRDVMNGKGMVALGRAVRNKRERVIALEPHGKGILAIMLRYPYEVRKAQEHFDAFAYAQISGEMLKLAEHILDTKAADFDPSTFEDHYETALVEPLKKLQAVFQPPKGKEGVAAPRNVINLMNALRASIAADTKKPKAASKRAAPGEETSLG